VNPSTIRASADAPPHVVGGGLALVEPAAGELEVNLDYAATTPALQATLDAVSAFLPHYGSVHRGGGRRSALSTDAFEVARSAVAGFVGCPAASSTIFVRNTTEAANVLAAALPAGSRVLCTPFEHHANLLPWRVHRVEHLPFVGSADDLVEALDVELTAARVVDHPFGLVAVSGASNVSGEVTPLSELAAVAHSHGARVFVDAAQLAPHRPIDMAADGIDFLAFSGHKLYAPFGTGALIARDETLADGLPLLRGGGAVRLVSLEDVAWSELPHRYEAGTPNTVGAVALGAACRALSEYGMSRLREDEQRLGERLWSGLQEIRGVRLLRMWRSAADRVGVAAFTVPGHDSHGVAAELSDRFGIAVRSGAFCAHPLVAHLLGVPSTEVDGLFREIADGAEVRVPGAVRASIGVGVSEEAIDRLLEALEAISGSRTRSARSNI
jgi:selenocysteine lyase/cysteine desulfurase